MNISFEEIRIMFVNQFRILIRNKCNELALEYRMRKRGSKGCEIEYKEIKTADIPSNCI